jgi:hypothetical protein
MTLEHCLQKNSLSAFRRTRKCRGVTSTCRANSLSHSSDPNVLINSCTHQELLAFPPHPCGDSQHRPREHLTFGRYSIKNLYVLVPYDTSWTFFHLNRLLDWIQQRGAGWRYVRTELYYCVSVVCYYRTSTARFINVAKHPRQRRALIHSKTAKKAASTPSIIRHSCLSLRCGTTPAVTQHPFNHKKKTQQVNRITQP